MASVFRWTVVYWTLAQVVIYCSAVEDPVHIQLYLDGKDSVKDVNNAVKMWYDSQNEDTPQYDAAQRPLIEKAGLKKLYIRGKFQVKDIKKNSDVNEVFLWDNGKKNVNDLGEFILKIFKPDAVVIVVFPDVHSYTGYQFQKELEKVVQVQNEGITVGRAVINVYLGLGDKNQKDQVHNLLEDEIKKQKDKKTWFFEKHEKYYSIFAEYNSNKFSFSTVFSKQWNPDLKPVNIYRVKIQEADSVVVKLMSVCTSDQNGLKVGGYKEQDLADVLLKLLHVDDVKTHPKQRIRVELPENCGTAEQRVAFTGELVDKLQMKMKDMKEIRVYGKEPQVHIQFYIDEMADDIKNIKNIHQQDIYININKITPQDTEKFSSAKELFIHIHCHGKGWNQNYKICEKNPKDLADILINFALKNSEPKTAIIRFNVCQAGTDYGQKYVNTFLTIFDELLQKYQITIQESWSYKYTTSQIGQHTVVSIPPDEICNQPDQMFWPKENEKDIFGSFTVRTIKTTQGYTAFPVLPLTKYDLVSNN